MTTREEAICNQLCMTPIGCDDCSKPFRSYMVHDAVWPLTGLPRFGAVVCVFCLERRVGRPLTADDFDDCACNEWLPWSRDARAVAEPNSWGTPGFNR